MTAFEAWAAAASAACVLAVALWLGPATGPASRGARALLWLALASPIPGLLLAPFDRPQILVSGPGGLFEALRLTAFAACGGAAVLTLLGALAPRRPTGAWGTLLLLALGSLAGLALAVLRVL